jgi:hypothetical protein
LNFKASTFRIDSHPPHHCSPSPSLPINPSTSFTSTTSHHGHSTPFSLLYPPSTTSLVRGSPASFNGCLPSVTTPQRLHGASLFVAARALADHLISEPPCVTATWRNAARHGLDVVPGRPPVRAEQFDRMIGVVVIFHIAITLLVGLSKLGKSWWQCAHQTHCHRALPVLSSRVCISLARLYSSMASWCVPLLHCRALAR